MNVTILAAVLGLALGLPASAQVNAPASETDHAKFVRLTRHLEAHPLSDTDKSMRTWLLAWATETKDVTVVICDILGPLPAEEHPFGPYLLTQMLFGNAAFQIANPARKSDLLAVQLAGLESALRTYSWLAAHSPGDRIPYFEELLQKKDGGSLETAMAPVITKACSEQAGA